MLLNLFFYFLLENGGGGGSVTTTKSTGGVVTTTKSTGGVVTTTKSTGGGCQDKNTNCAYWQRQGYCTNPQHQQYMRNNCCKSCGRDIL